MSLAFLLNLSNQTVNTLLLSWYYLNPITRFFVFIIRFDRYLKNFLSPVSGKPMESLFNNQKNKESCLIK